MRPFSYASSSERGKVSRPTFWLTFAIILRNCVRRRKSSCGRLLTSSNAHADTVRMKNATIYCTVMTVKFVGGCGAALVGFEPVA